MTTGYGADGSAQRWGTFPEEKPSRFYFGECFWWTECHAAQCSCRAVMVSTLKSSVRSWWVNGTPRTLHQTQSQNRNFSSRSIRFMWVRAAPPHTTLQYSRTERTLAKYVDNMARCCDMLSERPRFPVAIVLIRSPSALFALRTVCSTWSPNVSLWSRWTPRSLMTWTRSCPLLHISRPCMIIAYKNCGLWYSLASVIIHL